MKYVIESLQMLKELHKEDLKELKENSGLEFYGLSGTTGEWVKIKDLEIEEHKERIKEIEKAIMVLVMHDQALKFMCDW